MWKFSLNEIRTKIHRPEKLVAFLLILAVQCAFILPNNITIIAKASLSFLLILICLKEHKGKVIHAKYIYWITGLFAGVALSFAFVKDLNYASDYCLKFILSYLVVFSIMQIIENNEDIRFCFDSFMICGVIYLFLIILFQGPINVLSHGIDRKFTNGTMMNLTYISIPTSILIGWNLIEKRMKPVPGALLWIFVYVMNVLSERRKATLIPLIAIIVLYLIKNRKQLNIKKFLGLTALCGVIVAFLWYSTINPYLYEHFGYRVYNLYTTLLSESGDVVYADKSLGARASAIQTGIDYFMENPLKPLGIGNFGRIYILSHAHNNYVEMISTLGIWTACIYYGMYLLILIRDRKSIKSDLSLLAVSFIIINLITDYATSTYWESTYASYLMLCYMTTRYDYDQEDSIK